MQQSSETPTTNIVMFMFAHPVVGLGVTRYTRFICKQLLYEFLYPYSMPSKQECSVCSYTSTLIACKTRSWTRLSRSWRRQCGRRVAGGGRARQRAALRELHVAGAEAAARDDPPEEERRPARAQHLRRRRPLVPPVRRQRARHLRQQGAPCY